MPGLRLRGPSHRVPPLRAIRQDQDGGEARSHRREAGDMTEEETARFALVLRECERIRAMIAEDEAARSSGGDDSIPAVEAPAGGRYRDPAMVAAA